MIFFSFFYKSEALKILIITKWSKI